MTPLCAVSVDLDPIPCYYRIHALGRPPSALRDVVMRRCLPRFAELFREHGVKATFFVVGEDVDDKVLGSSAIASRQALGGLVEQGHELGNHSYSHPYNMGRLGVAEVANEIGRADDLLAAIAQGPIKGFRAPGYDLSATMLGELCQRSYAYDSSVFPAPGYYVAKAVVMAGLSLLRRKNGAVLTNPRALVAPTEPYRPKAEAPWRRGNAPILELPIAVTPWTRTPVIGTSLLLAPPWLRKRWIRAVGARPFFNLELHGIDLADAVLDNLPAALVDRQPDLRRSLSEKRQTLSEILREVSTKYQFATLADVAAATK